MEAKNIRVRKHICRYIITCIGVVLILISRYPDLNPNAYANEIQPGEDVTIVTPGTEARLCPQPACGPDQHIVRIPEGTVLTIQSTEVFAIGTFRVKWFEVVYKDYHGWVSIYDTDFAKK